MDESAMMSESPRAAGPEPATEAWSDGSQAESASPAPAGDAPRVIKLGGSPLENPVTLAGLAEAVAVAGTPIVLVHGGGARIAALQSALGLSISKVDGLRVTDAASMEATEMALSGGANKRLVRALLAAGVDAIGLSGIDRGLLRCRKKAHPTADLGQVGEIAAVRAEVLRDLLDQGVVPVVSPVSLGEDGEAYNVNADEAAAAVAAALGARAIDFVSDVAGVLEEGEVLPYLSAARADALIATGAIEGGMVNKVRAAQAAADLGIPEVRIVDVDGLALGEGTWVEAVVRAEGPDAARSEERAGAATPLEREAELRAADEGMLEPGVDLPMSEPVAEQALDALPEPIDERAIARAAMQGWSAEAIIDMEARHVVQTYVRPPLVFTHGRGALLFDSQGREFLDLTAGIAVNALGHSDPGLAQVVAQQAERLVHTSNLYHTPPQALLAQRLAESSFADRVFFTNSGTEANEAAIKFARRGARPGARVMVAFDHAFHGRSVGSVSLTQKPAYREPFFPLMPLVRFAPFNDVEAARAAIDEEVCAVFVEPVQGEGGVRPASPQFLRALREACDAVGASLVFDEVQCGLGRSGRLWAHEASGVTPDMMSIAKPLAGGLPIGALLCSEAVAERMQPGHHGSTFAGGPLVCSAAIEVFDRVADPGFLAEVEAKAERFMAGLAALEDPRIRELRGLGLLMGMELSEPVAPVVEAARERGMLLIGAGPDVLRLCPPLVIEDEQIDRAVALIGESLEATR